MTFTLFTLPKKARSLLKAASAASLAQSYAIKIPDNYPTADQCPSPAFVQQVSANTNLSTAAGMGMGTLIYGLREGMGEIIQDPLTTLVPIVNLMLSMPLRLLTGMEAEKCIQLTSFWMGIVAITAFGVSADAEPQAAARPAAGNAADRKDVKQAIKPTFDQRFQDLVNAHQPLAAAHPHDRALKAFNKSLTDFKTKHRCPNTLGGNRIINNPITLAGHCVDRDRHLDKPNLPATDVYRRGRMEKELEALEARWKTIEPRFKAGQAASDSAKHKSGGAAAHPSPSITFKRVTK